MTVQHDPKADQWVFLSLFRGQSHDIKALVIRDGELYSGGNTTDICVYKLRQGTLSDQYGKDSTQQLKKAKLRHVPPFPFTSPVSLSQGLMLMQAGTGLDVYDCGQRSVVLRIDKKGDYLVQESALEAGYIAYSDCRDTQVFHFS